MRPLVVPTNRILTFHVTHVIDEAACGNDEDARNRLDAVAGFSVLRVNEEVPLRMLYSRTFRGNIYDPNRECG